MTSDDEASAVIKSSSPDLEGAITATTPRKLIKVDKEMGPSIEVVPATPPSSKQQPNILNFIKKSATKTPEPKRASLTSQPSSESEQSKKKRRRSGTLSPASKAEEEKLSTPSKLAKKSDDAPPSSGVTPIQNNIKRLSLSPSKDLPVENKALSSSSELQNQAEGAVADDETMEVDDDVKASKVTFLTPEKSSTSSDKKTSPSSEAVSRKIVLVLFLICQV